MPERHHDQTRRNRETRTKSPAFWVRQYLSQVSS
jgi:hypothetical protein